MHLKNKINIALVITIILLVLFIIFQATVISSLKEEEEEWIRLEKVWREKMDTCMNRNARIYEELYNLQEYKIMKLKENKKEK